LGDVVEKLLKLHDLVELVQTGDQYLVSHRIYLVNLDIVDFLNYVCDDFLLFFGVGAVLLDILKSALISDIKKLDD
jgi:hypothetical protein